MKVCSGRDTENFPSWFKEKIMAQETKDVSEIVQYLAFGPRKNAISYSSYIINGQRYHSKKAEGTTQNSGVSLEATTLCRSSSKDKNQVMDKVFYYGVIKDIILLQYRGFQVPLFDCDWANVGNGVKVEDGFTLVNLHQGQHQFEKDPFILPSQAKQVFYSRESDKSNWYVLLQAPPRGFHELDVYDGNTDTFSRSLDLSRLDKSINHGDNYLREDCEWKEVEDE